MYVEYELFTALPSRSIYKLKSICKIEEIVNILSRKSVLFMSIENLSYNDKKLAFIDWKLLRMFNKFNLYDFNESSSRAISEILKRSKDLHIMEL